MNKAIPILLIMGGAVMIAGTLRDANFWETREQRGDALFRATEFDEAAKRYTDPVRIGAAQYRNGDFEAAAKTFARVPGAVGAFNQGNAWLMHGKYDAAVSSYDRALGFRPGWSDAEENRAIAKARREKIAAAGKDREKEATDAYKPDEIAFDIKRQNKQARPAELAEGEMSEEALRATWLRRVQTKPADFLRAKFAYQAGKEAGK